jgi:hypothetical protein
MVDTRMISPALTKSRYYGQATRENLIVAKCACKEPHNFTWGAYVVSDKTVGREKADIEAVEKTSCRVCGKPYVVDSMKVLGTQNSLKPEAIVSSMVQDVSAIKAVK